jgi:hypothetical protein
MRNLYANLRSVFGFPSARNHVLKVFSLSKTSAPWLNVIAGGLTATSVCQIAR